MAVLLFGLPISCGPKQVSPPLPPPPRDAIAAVADAVVADASGPIAVPVHSTRKRIEAPSGGAITQLAVTPDGNAAVTFDELGGARLWPALDGALEPRVIELPVATQIAIAPDANGFLIAEIDAAGGLLLQVVDRDGLTQSRATFGIEPAYQQVVATDHGVIALRADQRIVAIAADGRITAQLSAEPGQRILGIAVTGTHAVAVVEDAQSHRRARELAVTLAAWGKVVPANDAIGARVALSPSGARLATIETEPLNNQTGEAVHVIEMATGTQLAVAPTGGASAIGMPDEDHVALALAGRVGWITLPNAGGSRPSVLQGERFPFAIGGGRAFAVASGDIVIAASPAHTEYLGFAMQTPGVTAALPGGKLLIGLGVNFTTLDDKLHGAAAPDLGLAADTAVLEVCWLGGDDWLVETQHVGDGLYTIALVDVAQHKTMPLHTGLKTAQLLAFDAGAQLVGISLGTHVEVLRHTPGKLDKLAALPKPTEFERAELLPVSPKLAGGTQVIVALMREQLTLRWVRDARSLDKGVAVTIDGSPAGADATGAVYVWQNDPKGALELAVFRDGKRVGALPTDGPTTVWPDPSGTQVVAVGQRALALIGTDGTRKWTQSVAGATSALWLDDGALAIVSSAGIARVDVATGKLVTARCGWGFGLSPKQHPAAPRIEPICSQLR